MILLMCNRQFNFAIFFDVGGRGWRACINKLPVLQATGTMKFCSPLLRLEQGWFAEPVCSVPIIIYCYIRDRKYTRT